MEFAFESVRLFAICEAMSWAHLPWSGGLYDQHPKLIDDWFYIFHKRQEHEERKRKQEQATAQRAGKKPSGRRR